jgi:hypothetical protein
MPLHLRPMGADQTTPAAVAVGGCACRAVRFRLLAAPLFVHCCHCTDCQRHTGSAFVINLLIEARSVELTTGSLIGVDVPRDHTPPQRIFHCAVCQTAIFSKYGHPGVRFVRAGTLDRPSQIEPDVHIYTRSRLPWVTLPPSTPAFDGYYDEEQLWPASSLARVARLAATGDR